MLRDLVTRHENCRLYYGQVTTSGGNTVTKNIGGDDLATAVEAAAGLPTLTLKHGARRTPVVVSQIGADVADGGYSDLIAATTTTVFRPSLRDQAGSGDDGTVDYLVCGWDTNNTDRTMPQCVSCTKRRSRIIGAKVTGATPTVNFGSTDISVSRTSQGVYAVTIKRAFAATPIVLATAINSTVVRAAKVTSKAAGSFTISFFDEAQAVQDANFYMIIIGSDCRDEHGNAFDRIRNPQRKPRLVAGQLTITAGAPAFTINSNEFSSVTDNGTGDFTLNLNNAFRQECIVIATARAGRAHVHTGSASAPRLLIRDAAGAAADPTTIDFVLLGTDDPSEY